MNHDKRFWMNEVGEYRWCCREHMLEDMDIQYKTWRGFLMTWICILLVFGVPVAACFLAIVSALR